MIDRLAFYSVILGRVHLTRKKETTTLTKNIRHQSKPVEF